MIDAVFRAWCIPEKRMVKTDMDFTGICLKYLGKNENGDRDEIGFLKNYEGEVLDFQMYSSKKDMQENLICDGDIVYCSKIGGACKVRFNGCSFTLLTRDDIDIGLLENLNSDELIIMGNTYEGVGYPR